MKLTLEQHGFALHGPTYMCGFFFPSKYYGTTDLLGFPGSSAGKKLACNAGNSSSIPGSGRSSGERKDYPLQYPGLENSMNCIVHGVTKSRTQLSDFHFM